MAVEQYTGNEGLDVMEHNKHHNIVAVDKSAAVKSIQVFSDRRVEFAEKAGITPEGGFYVWLTNKTGGSTTKGYAVKASSTTANAFEYCSSNDPDIIGVVYDASIADGSACRIVFAGIADVYVNADGASLQDFVRMNATGDTSTAAGVCVAEAVPSSPFATDKHFQEMGHALESRVGAGLIKCLLHFN
jgi:glycine/serine hydroxymethyltransferase